MRSVSCDLCGERIHGEPEVRGWTMKQDYCAKCVVEVDALYAEIEELLAKCQKQWGDGLRKIMTRFNRRRPDGHIEEFSWLP